ncbi:LysR substrate-binding domain-containing protein, partial [Chroococcidiopsis sp.]|uniref:LysR substrate-binding domain-containing protein n=1 Tax=Chroococcidiopsis sp. TaxID=3088168 RepID=UPI003F32E830
VLEVNTLDAFRGVARQGELIALLPQSALVESRLDPTLAVRPIANTDSNGSLAPGSSLSRQVVMVTSQDRLSIPPIQYFWQLVRELVPPKLSVEEEETWGDKGEKRAEGVEGERNLQSPHPTPYTLHPTPHLPLATSH